MLMPSIALPTGPYDWNPNEIAREAFDARLADLRERMRSQGLTHAVVYGNTFDHAALIWFANFTPKLGPALLLVPAQGAPRLLFSGGPGMKPSAQRLTWVEDVAAMRGLGRDLADWLKGAASPRVGLVAPEAILQGDWDALHKGAGTDLVALDPPMETPAETFVAAARLLQTVVDHVFVAAQEGEDLLTVVLGAERVAYAQGAQDVRWRVARKPWGRPVTLPDSPLKIAGCLPVALAVRCRGLWAYGDFVLGDVTSVAAEVREALAREGQERAWVNRVAFPEPDAASGDFTQVVVEHGGARWSGLRQRGGAWLFRPPGL
jgi:hypothetical protein